MPRAGRNEPQDDPGPLPPVDRGNPSTSIEELRPALPRQPRGKSVSRPPLASRPSPAGGDGRARSCQWGATTTQTVKASEATIPPAPSQSRNAWAANCFSRATMHRSPCSEPVVASWSLSKSRTRHCAERVDPAGRRSQFILPSLASGLGRVARDPRWGSIARWQIGGHGTSTHDFMVDGGGGLRAAPAVVHALAALRVARRLFHEDMLAHP